MKVGDMTITAAADFQIEEDNIVLYPNPDNDILNFENVNDYSEIIISDILGKTILQKNISGSYISMEIESMEKGMYFVSLIKENGILTTKKFIKE